MKLLVPSGPLPIFDREIVAFDTTEIHAWTLRQLKELGVHVPLERVHEVVRSGDVQDLVRSLTERTLCREVRSTFATALRRALPTIDWPRAKISAVLQFRLQLPGLAMPPAHSDFGIGHQLEERNLWSPLTEVSATRALHMTDLKTSIALDANRRRAGTRYFSHWPRALQPVAMQPGQALLFTSMHAHGARVNVSSTTRVSFDVRFMPAHRAPRGVAWISVQDA